MKFGLVNMEYETVIQLIKNIKLDLAICPRALTCLSKQGDRAFFFIGRGPPSYEGRVTGVDTSECK